MKTKISAQAKKQQGFTLIELIVVIVILGILAATALPRFAGLEKDARFASAKGILGSVQSASALAHAKWLVQGASGVVSMEGATVAMTNGYPDATANGIAVAAGLVTGQGYTIAYGTPTTITPDGVVTGPCQVQYTAASAAGAAPTIALTATSSATCQ